MGDLRRFSRRLQRRRGHPLEEFPQGTDPITQIVIASARLFPYSKALAAGGSRRRPLETGAGR
jgi:hypothetical protein